MYGKSWDKSLPYTEFSYNNSYQVSIKMAPSDALYGSNVEPHCFGVTRERAKYSDWKY
jgi:hypothetical protein